MAFVQKQFGCQHLPDLRWTMSSFFGMKKKMQLELSQLLLFSKMDLHSKKKKDSMKCFLNSHVTEGERSNGVNSRSESYIIHKPNSGVKSDKTRTDVSCTEHRSDELCVRAIRFFWSTSSPTKEF